MMVNHMIHIVKEPSLLSLENVSPSSGIGLLSLHSVQKEFVAPIRCSSPCKCQAHPKHKLASVPLSTAMNFEKFIPQTKPRPGNIAARIFFSGW